MVETRVRGGPAPVRCAGLCGVGLLALTLAGRAQSVRSFDSTDHGLPSIPLYGGAQLADGRVAFACTAGLAYYDGRTWQIDERPLRHVACPRFVALDARGVTWLGGTKAGEPILRLRDGDWSATPSVATAREGEVKAFEPMSDAGVERLLFATGVAAYEFDGERWRTFATREELGGTLRTAVPWAGAVALGSDGGLALWSDGALRVEVGERLAREAPDGRGVLALASEAGPEPCLWILGAAWIACARGAEFERLEIAPLGHATFDAENAHRILPDGAGGLWVGSHEGLAHFEAATGELRAVRRDAHPVAWAGVNDLLCGSDGVLWLAHDRGVHRLPSARFENYGRPDGLLEDDVTAIIESPPGRLVLGHRDGLSFLERGRLTTLPLPADTLRPRRVLSIAADETGRLWIARSHDGAVVVAPDGTVERVALPAGSIVTSVLADRGKNVWMTVGSRLYKLQGESMVDQGNPLGPSTLRRMVELADGRLGLATTTSGIALLEGDAWRRMASVEKGAADSAFDMRLLADGTLLVATEAGLLSERDGVLERWRDGSFAVGEPVYAILEHAGDLWLGTRDGVLRWDGSRARRYAIAQGLASREINRAGLCSDSFGRLWIGGVGGMSRYRPELDRAGDPVPRVALEAIAARGRRTDTATPLALAHDENDVEIRFHGISFADAGRVTYRFRLHGYDTDWIVDPRAAEGGLVRYTNLPPGDYRFEVAARVGDGPWSASARSETIDVASPYWQRGWFRLLAVAALAALGWGANGLLRQRRSNAQLDRLVRARTEQLLATTRRYREVFEKSRAPQLLVGRQDGTILAANRAAEEFYGLAVEALVGERFARFEVPAEGASALDLAAVEPDQGRRFESAQRQASGAVREVELYASCYEVEGRLTVQVLLHDVTEQRLLQEKLQVAQRMESIGLLAGGIAHDFNNILTVIQGNAELALGELDPEDPRATVLRGELLQIRESGQRAAGLTRQLLEFSRRRVVRFEPLDLNAIVRELEPLARRLTREDIELSLDLDPALEPILAERSQMEQVVLNLVVNASEAMPSGGRISIRTRPVELSGGKSGQPAGLAGRFARLEVSDTGIGMDAATARRIFEPFFTRKPMRGTGLGLATLHGIVEQTGGRVEVESEPGRGSTFCVWLPVAADCAASVPSPSGVPTRLRGTETILLCEDDDAVRELTGRVLAEHGYRVLPAALPSRALELAEDSARSIDLLVSDVILPERNGRELAEAVQALRPGLPVLYVSGYTADVIARHGMLAAGIELLHKPFRVPELLQRVRTLLDRSSTETAAGATGSGLGERV